MFAEHLWASQNIPELMVLCRDFQENLHNCKKSVRYLRLTRTVLTNAFEIWIQIRKLLWKQSQNSIFFWLNIRELSTEPVQIFCVIWVQMCWSEKNKLLSYIFSITKWWGFYTTVPKSGIWLRYFIAKSLPPPANFSLSLYNPAEQTVLLIFIFWTGCA